MRLLHVAVVGALALFACCDAALADPKNSKLTSADDAALADGNHGRFLRKRDAELDSDEEDRAIAELEDMSERLAASKVSYRSYYKAKMTPKQVAVAIGLSLGSRQQAAELQRFYLGYYSYYTAKKRRERRKKELEGYIYPASTTDPNPSIRLGYLVLVAITGLLACCDAAATSDSKIYQLTPSVRELRGERSEDKRALRSEKIEEDSSDDLKPNKETDESDDEEERDLIISTIHRPKYWRWFHAGMTPYAVKEVQGLTGVRRLWKPIKRREYEGYVVFYDEHCRKPKYKSFCRAHAGA